LRESIRGQVSTAYIYTNRVWRTYCKLQEYVNKQGEEKKVKRKCVAVIGTVVCFMMIATFVWALPGVPNGTIKDGNLVWLRNADCFGKQNWNQAKSSAASLKSGSCGLTDGSTAGQWRLPTLEELKMRSLYQSGFNNVKSDWYWTSSDDKYGASFVDMINGVIGGANKTYNGG